MFLVTVSNTLIELQAWVGGYYTTST